MDETCTNFLILLLLGVVSIGRSIPVERNYTLAGGESLVLTSPGYPECCEAADFTYHIYCKGCSLFFSDVKLPPGSRLSVYAGPSISSPLLKSADHIFGSSWLGPDIFSSHNVYTVHLDAVYVPGADAANPFEYKGVKFTVTSFWTPSNQTTTTEEGPQANVSTTEKASTCVFGRVCADGSCGFECPEDPCGYLEKLCDDGSCVNSYQKCPGDCSLFEKKCPDGKCVRYSQDCPEPGCTTSNPYKCRNSYGCYSSSDKCDRSRDCSDGTDEENCYFPDNDYNDRSEKSGSWPWYFIPIIIISIIVICVACVAKMKRNGGGSVPREGARALNQPPILAGVSTSIPNNSYPTVTPGRYASNPETQFPTSLNSSGMAAAPEASAPPAYFEALSPEYDYKPKTDMNEALPSYNEAVRNSAV